MDDRFELIRSNKGGMKLIHRGYMYTVHKKRQSGGIRWRCTQRSLHCKGSVSTGCGAPRVNMPHNHIPDPHSVALARCRQFEELADAPAPPETECQENEAPLYTPEFRKQVVQFAEKSSNRDAQRFFNVPETNVRRWRKRWSANLKNRLFDNRKEITCTKGLYLVSEPTPSQNRAQEATKSLEIDGPQSPKTKPSNQEAEVEEVCLRWNSHHNNMKSTFPALLQREQFIDVTLTSEGKNLKCHKLVLSSCSAYFDDLLSSITPSQHPVIFLNGVPFWILKCLIDFMYAGEVHIEQNKLEELLKVAEILQIKGLTAKTSQLDEEREVHPNTPVKAEIIPITETTPKKESTATPHKLPPAVITAIDPLSLLQPAFVEETLERDKPRDSSPVKKIVTKKVKKRKLSDHEPSPPPVLYRKGTKSRPHVKVPRHYHDYENLEDRKPPIKIDEPEENTATFDIGAIKSEPIDIEDTDVGYNQSFDERAVTQAPPKNVEKSKVDDANEIDNKIDVKRETDDLN